MSEIRFDHIAIAARRMADAPVAVDLDAGADEGPLAVEFTSVRAVDLPPTPHPMLGTTFRQSPR